MGSNPRPYRDDAIMKPSMPPKASTPPPADSTHTHIPVGDSAGVINPSSRQNGSSVNVAHYPGSDVLQAAARRQDATFGNAMHATAQPITYTPPSAPPTPDQKPAPLFNPDAQLDTSQVRDLRRVIDYPANPNGYDNKIVFSRTNVKPS